MFVVVARPAVDRGGGLAYVPRFSQSIGRSIMFTFLLVVHAIIAALLVTVILMQRSEGGGLTTGGSPSGLMSARGAADFLTRSTAILAALFIGMSILLAVLAATRHSTTIDASNARTGAEIPKAQTPATIPGMGAPLATEGNAAAPAAAAPAANFALPEAAPAAGGNSTVPLAQ